MYDNKKIIHIIVLIIYIIVVSTTTLLVYIYIYSKSLKSYYLIKRHQFLLLITTLGVITTGPTDIYIIGFNKTDDNKYMFIKLNVNYIFVVLCFISYSYRGFLIYLEHIKNIVLLNKDEYKLIKIKNNINFMKKSCILFYIIVFVYTLIIDILYYNDIINFDEILYYFYYIIIVIYDFILHPLIIYLLHKIKSDIKYDYIITMIIIGFNYIIFIICNFTNIKYEWFILTLKDYLQPIAGMLNYLAYLVIPLIYTIRFNNTKINNINYFEVNDFKKINIETYNEYINIRRKFKNNNESKKMYKDFYENKIKNNINIYGKYKSLVIIIENKFLTNEINIDIFDKLFNEIHKIILIEIYENNITHNI